MAVALSLQPSDSATTRPSKPRTAAARRRPGILPLQVDVLDRHTVGIDRDVELLILEPLRGHLDLVLTRREVDRERAVRSRLRLGAPAHDRERRALHRLAAGQ